MVSETDIDISSRPLLHLNMGEIDDDDDSSTNVADLFANYNDAAAMEATEALLRLDGGASPAASSTTANTIIYHSFHYGVKSPGRPLTESV